MIFIILYSIGSENMLNFIGYEHAVIFIMWDCIGWELSLLLIMLGFIGWEHSIYHTIFYWLVAHHFELHSVSLVESTLWYFLHSISLVESIPENLTYGPGSVIYNSTFSAWKDLIESAQNTIYISSMYWTLRNTETKTDVPSAAEVI